MVVLLTVDAVAWDRAEILGQEVGELLEGPGLGLARAPFLHHLHPPVYVPDGCLRPPHAVGIYPLHGRPHVVYLHANQGDQAYGRRVQAPDARALVADDFQLRVCHALQDALRKSYVHEASPSLGTICPQ